MSLTYWDIGVESRYMGPAQIRLYIGPHWVDDACALMYQVSDNKVPKWGYNDEIWRAVAVGRTVVQGRISINFRFNGYLRAAILGWTRTKEMLDRYGKGAYYKETRSLWQISQMLQANPGYDPAISDPELNMSMLALSYEQDQNAGTQFSDMLKDYFYEDEVRDNDGQTPARPTSSYREGNSAMMKKRRDAMDSEFKLWRPGLFSTGFNIMIAYGSGALQDAALVKVLRDVHIVGESQVIEIDPPQGSRAVREVYEFIARDIAPGKVNTTVDPSGGYVNPDAPGTVVTPTAGVQGD